MYAILFVFSQLAHHNYGVGTYYLDTNGTLIYFTQLDFSTVSTLHFDAWALHLAHAASQDLWLTVYSLQIYTDKLAGEEVTILDDHTIFSLRNYVDGSLIEIRKSTV